MGRGAPLVRTLVYELSDKGLPSVAGDEVFTLETTCSGPTRWDGRSCLLVQPLGLLSGQAGDSGLERIEPDQLSSRDLDHGSTAPVMAGHHPGRRPGNRVDNSVNNYGHTKR